MPAALLLFEEMTREALRVVAPSALAVIPVGATEQHGPHLPAGTDAMHTEHVARSAAARVAEHTPVVVTPTLAFGCSPHHLPFGATISLSAGTLTQVLRDIGSSLAGAGFRRLFIVNGHGGNDELIRLMARDLALELGVSAAAGSWWAIAKDDLIAAGAAQCGRLPGHAGAFETSVVLALRPDLVAATRPHRESSATGDPLGFWSACRVETPGSWQAIDGYSDSPDRGSPERGRRFLEAGISAVAAAMLGFVETSSNNAVGSASPWRQPQQPTWQEGPP
jgi:creatinine amidohydrolase